MYVAGIVHKDTKTHLEDLYYKINTDLRIELANKASAEGVKQFIFIVYAVQGVKLVKEK